LARKNDRGECLREYKVSRVRTPDWASAKRFSNSRNHLSPRFVTEFAHPQLAGMSREESDAGCRRDYI